MSKKHNKIKRQKKRKKQTYQPNLLGQRKANNTVRGPKSNWTHSVMTLLMVLATASSTFYMWYKDIAKQRQEQSAKTNFSVRMRAEFHGPDSLKVTSIDSREIRSNNISFAMKLQVTNESERYIHLTRYNVDVTSGSRVVSVGRISISQPQYLVVNQGAGPGQRYINISGQCFDSIAFSKPFAPHETREGWAFFKFPYEKNYTFTIDKILITLIDKDNRLYVIPMHPPSPDEYEDISRKHFFQKPPVPDIATDSYDKPAPEGKQMRRKKQVPGKSGRRTIYVNRH